ncbi:MAG: MAPEG family protein [Aquisalinus sp.]|nr:MAPEG family protein [Aquisalinus sp.]
MDRDLIFWPIAVHLLLLIFLYGWLSLVRWHQRAGKPVAALEERISDNLSNQFEAPLLFYVIVALLWVENMVSAVDIALAWAFAIGRLLHTSVHTLTSTVLMRGGVFTINFLAIYGLWGWFFFRIWELG